MLAVMEHAVLTRAGGSDPPRILRLVGHPVRWRLLQELVRSDRAVAELTELLEAPQSLLSYHLGQLRAGELVSMRLRSMNHLRGGLLMANDEIINVRYMVDDVDESIAFYTKYLGFELLTSASPAFADVKRGNLRLLLAGPKSSAGRPMPDGRTPGPGGWNRIHFVVDDIDAEVARLRDAGATFRNDIVTGPGGKQILLEDPSGNVVELFEPAAR